MWIPITLFAATCQILRTSRQHELRTVLPSTKAAGFVRYAYGAPLAISASIVVFGVFGRPVPPLPTRFWLIVMVAGPAQIIGTVALLRAFRLRDFAVGTVYAKSEVILVAVFGAVALGEPLRPAGWLGAVLCTLGVAWLASSGSLLSLLRRAGDPAALMGVAAAALFAVAATGIRGASGALGDGPAVERALVTLTAMLTIQAILNGVQLAFTAPADGLATLRHWRSALSVGMLSLAGSAGWAVAVTIENVAKVRTLGQVELVVAFAIAHLRLNERHVRSDLVASAVVLAGIVTVTVLG